MSETWRVIELRDLDPYDLYPMLEVMISAVGRGASPNTLFIVKATEYVVVGKKANIAKKVKIDYCKKHNIPIVRGFMTHGSSALFGRVMSYYLLLKGRTDVDILKKAVLDALRELGLSVVHPSGANNLLFGKKKLGAIGSYYFKGTTLLSLILFMEPSVDLAEKTLISPHDMRIYTTTVNEALGREASIDEISNSVRQGLQRILGVEFEDGSLSAEEEELREKLKEKYTSESWIKTGRWSPVKDYGLR